MMLLVVRGSSELVHSISGKRETFALLLMLQPPVTDTPGAFPLFHLQEQREIIVKL